MQTNISKGLSSPNAGWFAGLSVLSGLGALAAKSCCILPFLLVSTGIGGTWLSRELTTFRPYFLSAAVLSLVLGWIIVIRRNREACHMNTSCVGHRTSWLTIIMLGLSTMFIGFFALWDFLKPVIFEYLKHAT